jgi:hypothetical protein
MGGAAARARVLMPGPTAQFTISSPVQASMRRVRPCRLERRLTRLDPAPLLYSFLVSVPSLGVVGGIASCFRASPSFASVSLISRRIV